MDAEIILRHFGFSDNEVKVYFAALELGMAPTSVIARKSRMRRTTTYEVLKKLSRKGFAEFFVKGKVRYYSVVSPKHLFDNFSSYISAFSDLLPSMMAISNKIISKPKITFYEGKKDLERMYMNTLNSTTEIVSYFNPDATVDYFRKDWIDEYIKLRVRNGIHLREISTNSELTIEYRKRDVGELRETKVAPTDSLEFMSDIFIYDDVMNMFSFDDGMAVEIKSHSVAKVQRAIFELAWESKMLL